MPYFHPETQFSIVLSSA